MRLQEYACVAYSIFGGDEYHEAALAFAKLCLCQPESFLEEDHYRLRVRPDGFNTGPEAFCDRNDLDYASIDEVLTIVTYWCQLNDVTLEIQFSGESFVCTFIEGDPIKQAVETTSSLNLCYLLLLGSSRLAKDMKDIELPRASRRWSEFTGE
jgi:hypothetical protein